MKHLIFIIVLLLASSLQAQELRVFSEAGYAVYIDGEFKGFTPNMADSLVIKDVPLGTHHVEVHLDEKFSREYTVDVKEGVNKISVEAYGRRVFPRADGYYIGAYDTITKGVLDRPVARNILIYFRPGLYSYGEWRRFYWTIIELPLGQRKNDHIVELYRKWLAGLTAHHRFPQAVKEAVFYGDMVFRDTISAFNMHYHIQDGRNHLTGEPAFEEYTFFWGASLKEGGKRFVMSMDEPRPPAKKFFKLLGMEERKFPLTFVRLNAWE